ncbi:MAG: hypothetical protein IPH91_10895 [Elusimicrobia bacterium]|nr:hypothetical protein [Elusimicrobiota bacterium]
MGSKIGNWEAAIRMGCSTTAFTCFDEIEKMRPNESGQHLGMCFLQILDPKQNTRVRENSSVWTPTTPQNLFIATANGLEDPGASWTASTWLSLQVKQIRQGRHRSKTGGG